MKRMSASDLTLLTWRATRSSKSRAGWRAWDRAALSHRRRCLEWRPSGAAAGAAVLKLTTNYLANADALSKLSARTGESTEELGALQFAFEQSDLSAQDMERALARLNEQGLRLDDIADEIASIGTISGQTARAVEIFGQRLGPRLLTVLNLGKAGLDSYRGEFQRLGLEIDQGSADAAAKFNDNIDTMLRVVEGLGNRGAQSVVNFVAPLVQGFGEATGVLPIEMKTSVDAAIAVFNDPETALKGKTSAAELANTFREGLKDPLDGMIADTEETVDEIVRLLRTARRAVARERFATSAGLAATQATFGLTAAASAFGRDHGDVASFLGEFRQGQDAPLTVRGPDAESIINRAADFLARAARSYSAPYQDPLVPLRFGGTSTIPSAYPPSPAAQAEADRARAARILAYDPYAYLGGRSTGATGDERGGSLGGGRFAGGGSFYGGGRGGRRGASSTSTSRIISMDLIAGRSSKSG